MGNDQTPSGATLVPSSVTSWDLLSFSVTYSNLPWIMHVIWTNKIKHLIPQTYYDDDVLDRRQIAYACFKQKLETTYSSSCKDKLRFRLKES